MDFVNNHITFQFHISQDEQYTETLESIFNGAINSQIVTSQSWYFLQTKAFTFNLLTTTETHQCYIKQWLCLDGQTSSMYMLHILVISINQDTSIDETNIHC